MVYDRYEKMIDEQLIDEVEQHGVIYNRQKYCINMGAGSANGVTGGGGSGGVNKYETKDEAWQEIAVNLRSDVETCKKRWKYLRERYVSQRKQGDPPVYEHLSRPYLEKMKFLDQHIQPRKSYRNVSSFLTSPNASNSFCEYNMDSSKSNSSMKNHSFNSQQHHQQQQQQHQLQQQQQQSQSLPYAQENIIKTEEDPTFRDFVAAVASKSQHLQQINPHHPSFNPTMMASPSGNGSHHNSNVISPAIQQQTMDNYDQYRVNEQSACAGFPNIGNGVASSTSSSMKSPLSSSPPPPPPVVTNNTNNNASSELSDEQNFATNSSGNSMKKARVQMSSQYLDTSDSDDSPLSTMRHAKMLGDSKHGVQHLHQSHQHQQQQQIHQQQHKHQQQYNKMFNNATRNMNTMNHAPSAASGGLYPSSNDFLFSLYQQMSPAAAAAAVQQERNINAAASVASTGSARSSEHLLGELVTSELLKMNKDRRKTVQKRILEILFFED